MSVDLGELGRCLNEAVKLIAHIGTTGAERVDVIKRADAWLEKYQCDNGKINYRQLTEFPDPEKNP